jgi:hypothetical protein
MTDKKLKVEFAPGCFDGFEGSQEELDELVAEIHRMAESGEIFEKSRPINFEDPSEADLEFIEHVLDSEINSEGRNLQ